jgi:hypothetical protein
MDILNNDVTNIIFKQISAFDKLQLYTVFDEPRPTKFQVSYELMASKDLYGYKGLIMRAITTPIEFTSTYDRNYHWNATMDMIEEQLKIDNYEPCVQVMVLIQKQLYWNTREDDVCQGFQEFRQQFRVLKRLLKVTLWKHACELGLPDWPQTEDCPLLYEWFYHIHAIYHILQHYDYDCDTYTDTLQYHSETDTDTDTDSDGE